MLPYGSAVYSGMIRFIEAPGFTARIRDYLDDIELAALRKLRWRGSGRGKSGGYRIICCWRSRKGEIWLLTIYAKSEESDIPRHVLRAIPKEIEE